MFDQNASIFLHKGDIVCGKYNYEIEHVIGSGSRITTYLTHYIDSSGNCHKAILKECCPQALQPFMQRLADHTLFIQNAKKAEEFQAEIEEVKRACKAETDLGIKTGNKDISVNIDSFFGNGTHYSVTYYIEGKTLEEWLKSDFCKEDGSYNIEGLLRIFSFLAHFFEELDYDHGCLYLDISAKNIYIPKEKDSRFVRAQLIDFDSIDGSESSQSKGVRCSADFAAPEIKNFDENKIGFASVIFSLSSLLFYCLFGRSLYADEVCSALNENPQYLEELEPNTLKTLKNQPPHIGPQLAALFASTLTLRAERRKVKGISEKLSELAEDCGENAQYLITESVQPIVPYAKLFSTEKLDDLLEKHKLVMVTGAPGTGKRTLAKYFANTKHYKYPIIQVLDGSNGLGEAIRAIQFKMQLTSATVDRCLDEIERCKHKSLLIIEDFDGLFAAEGNAPQKLKENAEENYRILKRLQKQSNTYAIFTRNNGLSKAEKKQLAELSIQQMCPQKPEMPEAFAFFTEQFSDDWIECQLKDNQNFLALEQLFQENDCNFSFITYAADKIKIWLQASGSVDFLVFTEMLSMQNGWLGKTGAGEKYKIPEQEDFQQFLLAVCLLSMNKKRLRLSDLKAFGIIDNAESGPLIEKLEQLPWIVIQEDGMLDFHRGFRKYYLAKQAPAINNPLLCNYREPDISSAYPDVISAQILLLKKMEELGLFEDSLNGKKLMKLYGQLSKTVDAQIGDLPIADNVLLQYYILKKRIHEKMQKRKLHIAKACSCAVFAIIISVGFILYMLFGRITVYMPGEQKTNYNFTDTVILSDVAFYQGHKNITSELSDAKIKRLIKAKHMDFDAEKIQLSYQADLSACTIQLFDCTFEHQASEYKIQIGRNPFVIKSNTLSLKPYTAETKINLTVEGFDRYQKSRANITTVSLTLSLYSEDPFKTVATEELPEFFEISGQPLASLSNKISIEPFLDNTDMCKRYNVTFDVSLPEGKYDFKVLPGVAQNTATGRSVYSAHRVFEITNSIVDMSIPTYSVFALENEIKEFSDGDSLAFRIEYKSTYASSWPYQYAAYEMKRQFYTVGFTFINMEVVDIPTEPYFEHDTVYAQTLIFHNVKNNPECKEKALCIPQGIAVSSNGRPTPYKRIDISSDFVFGAPKNDTVAPQIKGIEFQQETDTGLTAILQLTDNRILGADDTLCFRPNLIEVSGIAYERIVLSSYGAKNPENRELFIRFENMRLTGDAISLRFLDGFFQDTQGNPCEAIRFETSKIETAFPSNTNGIPIDISSPNDFSTMNDSLQLHIVFPDSIIDIEFLFSAITFDGFTADMEIVRRNKYEYDLYLDRVQKLPGATGTYILIGSGIGMDFNGNLTNSETIEVYL